MFSASVRSHASDVLNIGILVFREGLECILVLAAVTASMKGEERKYQRPVCIGAAAAFVATVLTWRIAVRIVDDLAKNLPALAVQAATGLLAILVLLVVMNWFFHKVYWTGWISLHNTRKQRLIAQDRSISGGMKLLLGLALLGFTSFYREGFEVVLFLQRYRLELGASVVFWGLVLGVFGSGFIAVLTFVARRHLPYRRMLVVTGAMLAVVLLVMVGEEVQEMQLARWVSTTPIPHLAGMIPLWMGIWFSIFPTLETLSGQAIAGILIFGSYFAARSSPASNS